MHRLDDKGAFRMAADAEPQRQDWGATRFVCHPASTGARSLTVIEATFEPGAGHAFHLHPDQEEALYVVAGSIEQWLDREMRMLGPGDSVFVPKGVVHASFNAGDGPARLLAIFGPCVGDGFTVEEKATEAPWSGLRG